MYEKFETLQYTYHFRMLPSLWISCPVSMSNDVDCHLSRRADTYLQWVKVCNHWVETQTATLRSSDDSILYGNCWKNMEDSHILLNCLWTVADSCWKKRGRGERRTNGPLKQNLLFGKWKAMGGFSKMWGVYSLIPHPFKSPTCKAYTTLQHN